MKKIAAFVATLSLAAIAFVTGAIPASAHGFWPGQGGGAAVGPLQSQTTSVGDQVFSGSCSGMGCFHTISRATVTGKVVADSGHFVAIVDSDIVGDDSDDYGVQTLGTGVISMSYSKIRGDFDIAGAEGRRVSLSHVEMTALTGSGAILGASSLLEYSWMHDFNSNTGQFIYGIHMWDVWQGCVGTAPPDGCGNVGPSTTVYGNLIQMDGNQWAAIWAAPFYYSNSGAQWYIQNNFFVGGASEVVHVEDPYNQVGWINIQQNHQMTGASYTISNYDVTCGGEFDNYSTVSAMPSPYGTACP